VGMILWLIFEIFGEFLLETIDGIGLIEFVRTSAIILFAFFANSIAGFGSGSISMGFVVQWWTYSQAVFLISVQEGVSHGVLMARNHRDFHWRSAILLVIGSLFGIIFGIWLIQFGNQTALERLLGVVILLGSLRLFIPKSVETVRTLPWPLDFVAGAATGISGALFNIEGPIIALYLSYRHHDHRVLRAQIILIQALIGFAKILLFGLSDLITAQILMISLLFIPFTLIGSNLGHGLSKRVNGIVFKFALGLILIFAGLNLLF
jgi:uncharacterized membrane protein YfcA